MTETRDEPASSAPMPAATVVEVEVQHAPAVFAQGICAGFATAAVLAAVWLATELAGARGMYRDFGGSEWTMYTPYSIRRAMWFTSPGWLWGVPVAGALAVAFLVLRRPRRLWPYLVVALVLAAVVALTWVESQAPLRELAGNISAD